MYSRCVCVQQKHCQAHTHIKKQTSVVTCPVMKLSQLTILLLMDSSHPSINLPSLCPSSNRFFSCLWRKSVHFTSVHQYDCRAPVHQITSLYLLIHPSTSASPFFLSTGKTNKTTLQLWKMYSCFICWWRPSVLFPPLCTVHVCVYAYLNGHNMTLSLTFLFSFPRPPEHTVISDRRATNCRCQLRRNNKNNF